MPSALANVSCADLGVNAVFEKLNAILGPTSHERTSVSSVLERFIARNYDFGTVYVYLRRHWVSFSYLGWVRDAEEQSPEKERDLLVNGRPLRLKPGYFEDDRCWFNRAWTIQEISEKMVIGGETGDDGTLEEDI
ncbi:hypothetical protein ARMSODRAFT_1027199 [Armillaria solidipes]|uniref:Uncharacterized protein n=1 Tax=Armillaria solidipes TaxID=1076256 RepID=A0A2H3AL87_9AGAR|nr:hypothetical protein ARMSODRAFT_1027199 [Armillaria solidipes]